MLYQYLLPLAAPSIGIISGLLLCWSKKNIGSSVFMPFNKTITLIRYAIIILFVCTTLQLAPTNSILFIILFLLSYLGTVLFYAQSIG